MYTIEDVMRHAGTKEQMADEYIRQMIHDEMPEYLWIDVSCGGKERILHCGRCGAEWWEKKRGNKWPEKFWQAKTGICPKCGEKVTAKHLSRGHNITDRLNVVWYKKSEVDPNIVVAIAAHCRREYEWEDRPWMLETEISIRGIAIIEHGSGSERWQTYPIWQDEAGAQWRGFIHHPKIEWRPVRKMGNLAFHDGSGFVIYQAKRVMFVETLKDAISGTPFERAWSEDYLMMDQGQDGTMALAMIAKYPCIEYLTKRGYTGFLRKRLLGELPANAINWRGKNAETVLKISAQRLGELKAEKIVLTPGLQQILQYADGQGIRISAREGQYIEAAMHERYLKKYKTILGAIVEYHQPNRRKKAMKYIARTVEYFVEAGNHRAVRIGDFLDYWEQCRVLGENMNDDDTAFPRDFYERHQRMNTRIKLVHSREKDALIAKRWEKLNAKFGFAFGGLELRPARSCEEVVREGEVLHHCVAGYVDRYVNGQTVICVLRRQVEPDAPWRTVEITPDGRVVQDRGWKNDIGGIPIDGAYREMLNLFWQAWRERKKTGRSAA